MATKIGYQLGILGRPNGHAAALALELDTRLTELGIDVTTLIPMTEPEIAGRNRKVPFIGVFFGYAGANDSGHPIISDLIADSVVIVPCVPTLSAYTTYTPEALRDINGFELPTTGASYSKLCALILENFHLLRSDRRLFISYSRNEAQNIAIQLYEKLDACGFDVFLDTISVPPGKDFQSILWHRLADSDLVVLLDTPGFRTRRWTREELARANATNIQILHLLWPTSPTDKWSAFSQFHQLRVTDFVGGPAAGVGAILKVSTLDEISVMVESLRARAFSARYRYLVDNFCDQAQTLRKRTAVQAERFISLEIASDQRIAVVPAIGVPSAIRCQEIENAIKKMPMRFDKIWLLYDERGILESWLGHFDWLNNHLPITVVRVSASSRYIAEASI